MSSGISIDYSDAWGFSLSQEFEGRLFKNKPITSEEAKKFALLKFFANSVGYLDSVGGAARSVWFGFALFGECYSFQGRTRNADDSALQRYYLSQVVRGCVEASGYGSYLIPVDIILTIGRTYFARNPLNHT